jgi:hypothetical protein
VVEKSIELALMGTNESADSSVFSADISMSLAATTIAPSAETPAVVPSFNRLRNSASYLGESISLTEQPWISQSEGRANFMI